MGLEQMELPITFCFLCMKTTMGILLFLCEFFAVSFNLRETTISLAVNDEG